MKPQKPPKRNTKKFDKTTQTPNKHTTQHPKPRTQCQTPTAPIKQNTEHTTHHTHKEQGNP